MTLGGTSVVLYPLYHPAAALYTRAMLTVLEADFARLPAILGAETNAPAPVVEVVPEPAVAAPAEQLGLF